MSGPRLLRRNLHPCVKDFPSGRTGSLIIITITIIIITIIIIGGCAFDSE
jgi:hypothetical protein